MKTLFATFAMLCFFISNAQQPVAFQKEIMGIYTSNYIIDFSPCNDGGAVLLLGTTDQTSVNYFLSVVKLNYLGNVEWSQNIIVNSIYFYPSQIFEKGNGQYTVIGIDVDTINPSSIITMINLNNNGVVSQKNIKTSSGHLQLAKSKMINNDLYIACNTYDPNGYANGMGVIKLDMNDNIIFDNFFVGDSTKNPAYDACVTSDGGVIVSGKAGAYMMLAKTDAMGNSQWNKVFTIPNTYCQARIINQLPDGNIIVGGVFLDMAGNYGFMMKIENTGNVLWFKNYNFTPSSIEALTSGDIVIHTMDNIYTYIAIADSNGNIISALQTSFFQIPSSNYSILKKAANDNIIVSITEIDSMGVYRSFLLKSDSLSILFCNKNSFVFSQTTQNTNLPFSSNVAIFGGGAFISTANNITLTLSTATSTNYCSTTSVDENVQENIISVYPNPSSGVFTIDAELSNFTVTVFDALGNAVYQSANEKTIDLSNVAKGIYMLSVASDNQNYSQRVLIE